MKDRNGHPPRPPRWGWRIVVGTSWTVIALSPLLLPGFPASNNPFELTTFGLILFRTPNALICAQEPAALAGMRNAHVTTAEVCAASAMSKARTNAVFGAMARGDHTAKPPPTNALDEETERLQMLKEGLYKFNETAMREIGTAADIGMRSGIVPAIAGETSTPAGVKVWYLSRLGWGILLALGWAPIAWASLRELLRRRKRIELVCTSCAQVFAGVRGDRCPTCRVTAVSVTGIHHTPLVRKSSGWRWRLFAAVLASAVWMLAHQVSTSSISAGARLTQQANLRIHLERGCVIAGVMPASPTNGRTALDAAMAELFNPIQSRSGNINDMVAFALHCRSATTAAKKNGMAIVDWRGNPIVVVSVSILRYLALPFFVPVLLLVGSFFVAWHRRKRGLCGSCAYPLIGLPEPRCPECGTTVMGKERRAEQA